MASLPKGSGIPTIVEGTEGGAVFSLEVSAHLMNLLAGLYSRREDAIVRETLSNAYDAQISIGVDTPVVIEAPSARAPVLKIRDRGPGMAKETVFRVYASYGKSTKGDSEEQTGGMGVGAKATFCYTDSFTVISWHGGLESTYVAYTDGETGIPRIDLMATVPCPASRTGVEVQVPVQVADLDAFNQAIQWNAKFHATTPIVVGAQAVTSVYETAGICWPLDGFGMPGWSAFAGNGIDTGVVMGSVYYPITEHSPAFGFPVLLMAPMGGVRFAPSREALKYDTVTVNNLKAAAAATKEAYRAWVGSLVKNAEDRFPGYYGERNRTLSKLARGPLAPLMTDAILKPMVGADVTAMFHPHPLHVNGLPYRIATDLYLFSTDYVRRSATAEKPFMSVHAEAMECYVNNCPGGEARLRDALGHTVRPDVFYTRDEACARALASLLGRDPETFLKYTDSLPEVERCTSVREPRADGRVGGKLAVYKGMHSLTEYNPKTEILDGDEALDVTDGVYVEALLGGRDYCSTSTDGKFQLSSRDILKLVTRASPWCDSPVTGRVMRLNAADRERLTKKAVGLVPLADVVQRAIDWEAAERMVRDWKVLGGDRYHHYGANYPKVFMLGWDTLSPALQALMVEHLNKANAGLGDLLLELQDRKSHWMKKAAYLDLCDTLATICPAKAESFENHMSKVVKDVHPCAMTGDGATRWRATMLSIFTGLGVPEAVLGRALCPVLAPVAATTAPVRPKAEPTPRVAPGQLSLFELPESVPVEEPPPVKRVSSPATGFLRLVA